MPTSREQLLRKHDIEPLVGVIFQKAQELAFFRTISEPDNGTITMHDIEKALRALNLNPAWHERAKKFMVAHWAFILECSGYALITQLPISLPNKNFLTAEWFLRFRLAQLTKKRPLKSQYYLVDVAERE